MLENATIAPLTASHCHLLGAGAIQRQHKRPARARAARAAKPKPTPPSTAPDTAVLAWSITANCSTLQGQNGQNGNGILYSCLSGFAARRVATKSSPFDLFSPQQPSDPTRARHLSNLCQKLYRAMIT